MKKSSKITIKFFLNENINGPIEDPNDIPLHPLYILVIFRRSNTKIRSQYGMYYESLEEVGKYDENLMLFEERIIRKLIEYEVSKYGEDEFSLAGLKDKFEIYSTSIKSACEVYLKDELRKAFKNTKDDLFHVLTTRHELATVERLFKAGKLLFKDFEKGLEPQLLEEIYAFEKYKMLFPGKLFGYNFPTVIDWVAGNHLQQLDELYKKTFNKQDKTLKAIHSLLENSCQKILSNIM